MASGDWTLERCIVASAEFERGKVYRKFGNSQSLGGRWRHAALVWNTTERPSARAGLAL